MASVASLSEPRIGSERIDVEVAGRVSDRSRRVLTYAAATAGAALGLGTVRVRVGKRRRGTPRQVVATASPDGIWIRASALRWSDPELRILVHEEVAHFKLITLGVAEGFHSLIGALVHEAFATGFSYRQWAAADATRIARIYTMPLPVAILDGEFGYRLGELLGAAGAGSEDARRRLARFYDDPSVDLFVKRLARRVEGILASSAEERQRAELLADLYLALQSTTRPHRDA